ncbi:MAG TPA: hypothetical protein VMZ91_09540, partial [Candidatus Paceibacterota bacterium]|nr:hypothetical protein [Candidatus Paceibacterota bacterium]
FKKINGEYHELAGSYSKRDTAEQNQKMWKNNGYKAKIKKEKRENGKPVHRLYIRNDKMKRYNHPDSYYKRL